MKRVGKPFYKRSSHLKAGSVRSIRRHIVKVLKKPARNATVKKEVNEASKGATKKTIVTKGV